MKEITVLGLPAFQMDNGEIVINPVYYNEYLSAQIEAVKKDRTKNFIITLVGLNHEYIRGNRMLVAEAFMFLNNMKAIINHPPQIEFYPHHFGPHSRHLINKKKELEDIGFISTKAQKIQLTKPGNDVLASIKTEYTPQAWAGLEEYRRKLDQKGLDGLMKLLYKLYPEYTLNFVSKDKEVRA